MTPTLSEPEMKNETRDMALDTIARGLDPKDSAAPQVEPVIRVRDLKKSFRRNDGTEVVAIDNVSFDVHPGESVVLLGPSGCGKTTLLRCIAGLEEPDSGEIEVNGRIVYSSSQGIHMRAELRRLAMVFQSYALWPHMTILDNIAYPLMSMPRGQRPTKAEAAQRVLKIMDTVGIAGLEKQYPNAISGGQQQRVALCRALIAGTNLVLFDEPLSNIDAQVRERLRDELLAMQRQFNFASLFVTHDRQEAMVLADRIAILKGGKMRQLSGPTETYRRPIDRFVAQFIGPINELPVTALATTAPSEDIVEAETQLGPIKGIMRHDKSADMVAIWRPEHGLLTEERPNNPNRWPCTVELAKFYGSEIEFTVRVDEVEIRVLAHGGQVLRNGTRAWLSVEPHRVKFLANK